MYDSYQSWNTSYQRHPDNGTPSILTGSGPIPLLG